METQLCELRKPIKNREPGMGDEPEKDAGFGKTEQYEWGFIA